MSPLPKTFRTPFAEYTRHEQIGEGGSGTVFRATSDGSEFAIKLLREDVGSSEKAKRFRNELLFALKTESKAIVRVLDYGEIASSKGHRLFYVMPHIPTTLRTILKARPTAKDALGFAIALLDAVEGVHLLGVIHRDLKPENVFWDPLTKRLMLGDFGVAGFGPDLMSTVVETAPGTRLANVAYAAPEQRIKGADVDLRADLFAVGLMINELFTGEVLQGAGYEKVSSKSPEHAYLDDIVEWLVQNSPAKRPSSLNEVKARLQVLSTAAVSRQKLDSLSKTVIDATTPDDPLIQSPPILVGADMRGSTLILKLSKAPTDDWIQAFQNTNYHNSLMGASPRDFSFSKTEVQLSFTYNEPSPQNVQRVVDDFKRFLTLADADYKRYVRRKLQEHDEARRQALAAQIEAERRRQDVLSNLKLYSIEISPLKCTIRGATTLAMRRRQATPRRIEPCALPTSHAFC